MPSPAEPPRPLAAAFELHRALELFQSLGSYSYQLASQAAREAVAGKLEIRGALFTKHASSHLTAAAANAAPALAC
eukprot:COSAG05_NODE_10649_length_553_cov_18.251101_1_plen_75_part_10